MRLDQSLLAAAVACLVAAPASAAINVYYHAGAWDAFDGQATDGQPICGLGSRNPTDGRSFSLSTQIGANDTTLVARKPGWQIPATTIIPVVIQIGLNRPWVAQGTGDGDKVEWTMERGDAARFDAEFRSAQSMTITFPSGNEKPWIIMLTGSAAVSNAMRRCVVDLQSRANVPAQTAAPAAPSQPATQPFAAPPANGSGNPAPVQPVAPAQPSQPNTPPAPSH